MPVIQLFILLVKDLKMTNSKSLIAYFSRKGNNYVGGRINYLSIGNTEVIAKKIKEITGSDLFKIETVEHYPDDYLEATEVAKDEKILNARPELTETIADMDTYDVIYIGYPNKGCHKSENFLTAFFSLFIHSDIFLDAIDLGQFPIFIDRPTLYQRVVFKFHQ